MPFKSYEENEPLTFYTDLGEEIKFFGYAVKFTEYDDGDPHRAKLTMRGDLYKGPIPPPEE